MNPLSAMLLFWAGLCAIGVLAAVLIVAGEVRASRADFSDEAKVSVDLHR
jgi:hypothetical protein